MIDSTKRLGHDLLHAVDLGDLVRSHPLAASLVSTLGGAAAGFAAARPRSASRRRRRVAASSPASDARSNGVHEGEEPPRRAERSKRAGLSRASGPIGQAIKAAVIAMVMKRLSHPDESKRRYSGSPLRYFLK